MKNTNLPASLEKTLAIEDLDAKLSGLMKEIVKLLNCDRCFLYVREPNLRMGKAAFCYCRSHVPNVAGDRWEEESSELAQQDPMFAAALNCQPSIFVEDVETADAQVVDREFEQEHFGHRALIHAHLCRDRQLWGVLQPSVFGAPRIWTTSDRELITALSTQTTPLVIDYVQQNFS
ncbi:MAG: GAF domain-containing protein [Pleurocapsa sp.]